MILAVDVQYLQNKAFAAGVLFEEWGSTVPLGEYVTTVNTIEDYEPGNFYKRELPCILQLINEHRLIPSTIMVDGYVFLDGNIKPGLGKRLFDALLEKIEVIGVAKNPFSGIPKEYELVRGKSRKPLFITTTGSLDIAKDSIAKMYGTNRLPALLKRVDQLSREAANKSIQPNNRFAGVAV